MRAHLDYPKLAGIYKLKCVHNGKIYIGKGVNIRKRLYNHKSAKEKGYLQNALIKYGWDAFEVEILEIFKDFDKKNEEHKLLIVEREAYYIELFDSTNKEIGYNICKYSTDATGIIRSESTREKISQSHMGMKMPPRTEEHKKNLSKALTGRIFSEETLTKMRLSHLGKKQSTESIEKRRRANLGRKIGPLSEERKENLRKVNLGKKHSEETKEKVRQANLGKKLTEEHKEKIRQNQLGRKHSEESKEKMRQAKLKNKLNKVED